MPPVEYHELLQGKLASTVPSTQTTTFVEMP